MHEHGGRGNQEPVTLAGVRVARFMHTSRMDLGNEHTDESNDMV